MRRVPATDEMVERAQRKRNQKSEEQGRYGHGW
jgi:hypothetical protein